ncbi:thiamine-binding protein [Roseivirga sp. E12]|uniref:thiamine-binding protein n=1 Tax=Roseivirga sp. E12 TaxID=2819237 RepID=UPI001ABCA87C|nr:thiamine-binding protein [Roseivirga sp. E12]MBO3697793.1 thiamine-binding protein [Roseivirga sp. E12]
MNQINLGIQVVPILDADSGYPIIDACIGLIQKSGIKHEVTPFETVLEGSYKDIMALVDQVYQMTNKLSPETVINIRIHAKKGKDVFASDKTEKF